MVPTIKENERNASAVEDALKSLRVHLQARVILRLASQTGRQKAHKQTRVPNSTILGFLFALVLRALCTEQLSPVTFVLLELLLLEKNSTSSSIIFMKP